ncbi:histidinol dehydrogenase [Chloroflexota bacterium]
MLVKPVLLKDLSAAEYEKIVKRSMLKMDAVSADVASIVEDVRNNGDTAVLKYAREFDNVELSADRLEVTRDEIKAAYDRMLGDGLGDTIESLRNNYNRIRSFHQQQLEQQFKPFEVSSGDGRLGRVYRPTGSAGVYAPGGTAPYPSTVLMAVTPAKIAGVPEVVVTTRPDPDGSINGWLLIACDIAGADRIFKTAGAQAIAALAFGTSTVPKVDKIVGPGNIYVTAAKIYVQAKGYCDIDFPAGPSEIVIIADDTAIPQNIVWDMFSQAEHDENACAVLVTPSKKLAEQVAQLLDDELKESRDRQDIKEKALRDYGRIIITDNIKEAIAFSNDFAPEHLAIMTADNDMVMENTVNAGTVCLGNTSPVAASDYASGLNHILPTGGWVRTCSGLSVGTFLKGTTFQELTPQGLKNLQADITNVAKAEGLYDGHGRSIEKRFQPDNK